MNTIGYFEIQSSQPSREISFYQSVFGWKFIRDPQIPIVYYRIETSGISGGLLERPVAVPPGMSGTNAFTCSIEVTDFDATAEKIAMAGGTVAMPKFAIPGLCWQGYFSDPDNNVFGIFQPDPGARQMGCRLSRSITIHPFPETCHLRYRWFDRANMPDLS